MDSVEPRRTRGDNVDFVVVAYIKDRVRRQTEMFANDEEGSRIRFR
jgi:hypothetical protein